MASATDVYARKVVRKGIFNLYEKNTGLILIAPRPTTIELQDGLGNNDPIVELDNQGYETKVSNNHSSRNPVVNMTFKGRNLDITALQLGRTIKESEVALRYPGRMQVEKASYAGAPDGKLGNRVRKDVDCRGSFLDADNGSTLLLVQQLFDSFNPLIPNSFAVGDNFERKFSNNLVEDNAWIVLEPSADYATRSLSEGLIGFMELNGICYLSDNTSEIVVADNCFVNPEGGGLKEGDTQVTLDISGLGKCQPWNIHEIRDEIYCDD